MPPSLQTGGPAGPAHAANAARNAQAIWWRTARWHSARPELWRLLERHLPSRAIVAVVGAGNAHDVPLHRLTRHAQRVDLIDLDEAALRRAKRRPLTRGRLHSIADDITLGAADAITHAVISGQPAKHRSPPPRPIGHAPYEVVIADLLYTQLLYPALADAALTGPAIDAALLRHGQPLTDAVVARLHASTPDGLLIHVHDILGWWPGHPQPFNIDVSRTGSDGDRVTWFGWRWWGS